MPRPASVPQFSASPSSTLNAALARLHEAEAAYHEAVAAVRAALTEAARVRASQPSPSDRRDGRMAYRVAEVARLVGISQASVVRAIDRGELRAVRLNSATDTSARLILTADLERWLAGLPER